jgi:hypothetical protein
MTARKAKARANADPSLRSGDSLPESQKEKQRQKVRILLQGLLTA